MSGCKYLLYFVTSWEKWCAGSWACTVQGLIVGGVSSAFLCEHETEMRGSRPSLWPGSCGGTHVISRVWVAAPGICRILQLLEFFNESDASWSWGVVFSDPVFGRVCVCICVCVQVSVVVKLEGEDVVDLLLWLFSSLFHCSGRGFFHSLCPFCLFLSVKVFRLVCIPYTLCYLKTLLQAFSSPKSQLSVSSILICPRIHEAHGFLTDLCLFLGDRQCCPCVAAVRRVQGAAGELCPPGGRPFADRETMETTSRGEHQRPQRPRPATSSSPSEPRGSGVTPQSRLLHQQAPSLLQMSRWAPSWNIQIVSLVQFLHHCTTLYRTYTWQLQFLDTLHFIVLHTTWCAHKTRYRALMPPGLKVEILSTQQWSLPECADALRKTNYHATDTFI